VGFLGAASHRLRPITLSPSLSSNIKAALDTEIQPENVLCRPLDPSGILCRPPLDPSAGVCFFKRKVESSIPLGSSFSPYFTGRATKGTWGNLGRQKEKEMIIHKWISTNGSELVPTSDVKINLTLPYLTLPYLTLPYLTLPYLTLPYLTFPYLTLPYLTLPYLTLPYLTLPIVCLTF
jgi:hypothetical protein